MLVVYTTLSARGGGLCVCVCYHNLTEWLVCHVLPALPCAPLTSSLTAAEKSSLHFLFSSPLLSPLFFPLLFSLLLSLSSHQSSPQSSHLLSSPAISPLFYPSLHIFLFSPLFSLLSSLISLLSPQSSSLFSSVLYVLAKCTYEHYCCCGFLEGGCFPLVECQKQ